MIAGSEDAGAATAGLLGNEACSASLWFFALPSDFDGVAVSFRVGLPDAGDEEADFVMGSTGLIAARLAMSVRFSTAWEPSCFCTVRVLEA